VDKCTTDGLLAQITLLIFLVGGCVQKSKAEPLWDGSSNMNPKNIGFWALIKEDFDTHHNDILAQGFFALFVHRLGNWRMSISFKLLRFPFSILYCILSKMTQVFCGIKLDYTVHVGRRVKIEHFGGMILGARSIGDDVVIRQNTTFGIRDTSDLSAKPIIESNVNIGAGVVIIGDITIGRGSKIAPNSVVVSDVPAFSTVYVKATVVTKSTAE
jgi:serine O-acetyltransferase